MKLFLIYEKKIPVISRYVVDDLRPLHRTSAKVTLY